MIIIGSKAGGKVHVEGEFIGLVGANGKTSFFFTIIDENTLEAKSASSGKIKTLVKVPDSQWGQMDPYEPAQFQGFKFNYSKNFIEGANYEQ